VAGKVNCNNCSWFLEKRSRKSKWSTRCVLWKWVKTRY